MTIYALVVPNWKTGEMAEQFVGGVNEMVGVLEQYEMKGVVRAVHIHEFLRFAECQPRAGTYTILAGLVIIAEGSRDAHPPFLAVRQPEGIKQLLTEEVDLDRARHLMRSQWADTDEGRARAESDYAQQLLPFLDQGKPGDHLVYFGVAFWLPAGWRPKQTT